MSTKFFTNEEGRTLIEKIEGIFQHKKIHFLDVLVGYFRASGYFRIRPFVQRSGKIRILVGINIDRLVQEAWDKGLKFGANPTASREQFLAALTGDIQKSAYDRDVEGGMIGLVDDIASGRVEIRIHPSQTIHAKVYIFREETKHDHGYGAVITGSSNLTDAGLVRNFEFNVELRDDHDIDFATTTFNRLWDEGIPVGPEHVQQVKQQTFLNDSFTPHDLFIKFLAEYFGPAIHYDPSVLEDLPSGFKRLSYQADAVSDGYVKLQRHGGFFLSDVVGLGKTLVATLIAKRFYYTIPPELQSALRQPYRRSTWAGEAGLLRQLFAQAEFFNRPHAVEVAGTLARQILQLGVITLGDGKRLGVFEVELASTATQIARNRVGLRELLKFSIDQATIHGALAFYHHPQIREYRFSLIASRPRIAADGATVGEETNPKRYTYVLGPAEMCRTPAERLSLLQGNRAGVTLPDVIEVFSVEKLTREFYQQLQHWYFWALGHARFPADAPKDAEGRDALSLIRLLTRLIFVWFLKEKGLVPETLFDERKLAALLKGFAPASAKVKDSVYYRAILQNLFFATLNCEQSDRAWARDGQNMMAHSLYRFRDEFTSPANALDLFKDIPFLNGGLFECLDKDLGESHRPRYVRIDGFSRRDDSQPVVPDFLFFGPETDGDLSRFYEEKKTGKKPRPVRVRGLIAILQDFKFTIEENTPLEEDVALDPELLGRVFENLLAAYNPETQVTARKQTGSFYTPREIVDYMTGQALFYALCEKLAGAPDFDTRLQSALAHDDAPNPFNVAETDRLIAAIDDLKILDPACGSGAFPMGVLHRLVHLLGKLDPGNVRWKQRQLDKVREVPDPDVREQLRKDVEQAFAANELGYGRKLYLIENCLYGVDIQPIAAQITKLRFFISLVVEQKVDAKAANRGIRPLPNLETKIVAANTLIRIERPGQQLLRNLDIDAKEAELRRVRDDHFLARTPKKKAKCREEATVAA